MAEHRVDLAQLADLFQHALPLDQCLVDEFLAQFVERLRQFVVRVERRQRRVPAAHDVPVQPQIVDLFQQVLLGRQELVHRRVQQAHGHRVRRHHREQVDEVGALNRQQPVQRILAFLGRVGEDHVDDDRQALGCIEHAFRAA